MRSAFDVPMIANAGPRPRRQRLFERLRASVRDITVPPAGPSKGRPTTIVRDSPATCERITHRPRSASMTEPFGHGCRVPAASLPGPEPAPSAPSS
jgi:hypothetical protein